MKKSLALKVSIALILFVISVSCILFLTACQSKNAQPKLNNTKLILDEITTLNHLNSIGNLSANDFTRIESMTTNDDRALDEINEIKTMSKYKEYIHVFHGLSSLQDYIETQIPKICPGHSLAHYYVFMKHNETILANNNFREAKDNFQKWIPLARTYADQNNLTDFNATVSRINVDLINIESNKTTVTDNEIEWLSTDGSICIAE